MYSYKAAGKSLGALCTLTPTMLLYGDRSKNACKIRWLDCSKNPPRPPTGKKNISTNQSWIRDMACFNHGGKSLLVATSCYDGICAYDLATGIIEWQVSGRVSDIKKFISPRGVCTDGEGRLYVADYNNASVSVFKTDGQYLHTLLKKGEKELGSPTYLSWCSHSNRLVVKHFRKKANYISVFKINAI